WSEVFGRSSLGVVEVGSGLRGNRFRWCTTKCCLKNDEAYQFYSFRSTLGWHTRRERHEDMGSVVEDTGSVVEDEGSIVEDKGHVGGHVTHQSPEKSNEVALVADY
ncbi:hypothetical protein K435DRAFT_783241, partial [Dendrothele bispora CBS 962.96]